MLYNPTPTLVRLLLSVSGLLFIAVYGAAMLDNPLNVNLLVRHLPPDALYWFGTDNLGRDLWVRCFQGALTSLQIGIGAALCSGFIALLMAAISRLHPRLDHASDHRCDVVHAAPSAADFDLFYLGRREKRGDYGGCAHTLAAAGIDFTC